MPDRYGDRDPNAWPQVPPPQAAPDDIWAAEQRAHETRAQAIVECGLCDDDGYNAAGIVCHHVDYSPAAERGMELIRQQMGWT